MIVASSSSADRCRLDLLGDAVTDRGFWPFMSQSSGLLVAAKIKEGAARSAWDP